MIKDYGSAHPLPDAAMQPDKNIQYKLLFDVTKAPKEPGKPTPGLDHLARLINLFETAGIPAHDMRLVAVIHGDATPGVLKEEYYQEQAQGENPNLDLLHALKQSGVQLFVCGQSLVQQGYGDSWVSEDVSVALSALSVLSTLQMMGYALMPY
jgi:intracellular sulfur oxidation DsrE/DsrF family protein